MEIECEVCNKTKELDADDLPSQACDDEEWTCPHCESVMMIGWYGVAEVRRVVQVNQQPAGQE